MNAKIEWTPAYSIGHQEIDQQHQELFELMDDIPDTLDAKQIKRCIMKLFKYTRTHFSEEETIMKGINYPDLEAHQRLHEDLISKLSSFGEYEFNDEESLADFKEFAYDWLADHIMNQDMNYHFFAKENNLSW